MMKLVRREKIFFILTLVFLVLSRFYLLSQIPATLTHDELVYAIQAKSFTLQGRTLDGQQGYFATKPVHPMYAEWPARVMSLGFLFTNDPLLATHLASVLMGILLPFLMACLVWQIWRCLDLVKATFLVFVFSPLFWQMSRLAYDAFYSLFFYVVAGVLLVQQNRKIILLSIPFFLIGFFQYQGFKLILLPWIGFLLALLFSTRKFSWQQFKLPIFVFIVAAMLTLFYGLILLPQQEVSSRLSHLIFNNVEYLERIVNTERRLSLDNPFVRLISNKVTAILAFMLQRLLGVFNLNTLLLLIEPNVSGFSVWTHGVFYWLEIFLAFVGCVKLFISKNNRLSGVVLISGMFILCLPALINNGGEWYLLRSMFSYLLLSVLAAWGLFALWQQKWLRLPLIAFYGLSILFFAYNYFYRYPIISLDWGNFDERLTARYISLIRERNPNTKITVYGIEPEYDFWSYLLYSQQLDRSTYQVISKAMDQYPVQSSEAEYQIDNVTFSSFCVAKDLTRLLEKDQISEIIIAPPEYKTCQTPETSVLVGDSLSSKETLKPVLSISAVLDSGEKLRIYGDEICHDFATTYVNLRSLDQLLIEKQDTTTFCSLWVKNLGLVK